MTNLIFQARHLSIIAVGFLVTALTAVLLYAPGVSAIPGDGTADADGTTDLSEVADVAQDSIFELFAPVLKIVVALIPLSLSIAIVFMVIRKVKGRLTGGAGSTSV